MAFPVMVWRLCCKHTLHRTKSGVGGWNSQDLTIANSKRFSAAIEVRSANAPTRRTKNLDGFPPPHPWKQLWPHRPEEKCINCSRQSFSSCGGPGTVGWLFSPHTCTTRNVCIPGVDMAESWAPALERKLTVADCLVVCVCVKVLMSRLGGKSGDGFRGNRKISGLLNLNH